MSCRLRSCGAVLPALFFACAALLAVPAASVQADPVLALPAQQVVTDLSDRRIEIRYSFAGADLILFGTVDKAVLDPAVDGYDVVVIVRGPEVPATVRKKERFGAIWANRAAVTFPAAPGYYAVAASRPLTEIADAATFRRTGIGFSNLVLAIEGGPTAEARKPEFMEALRRVRARQGLFRELQDPVEIIEERLFRTTIHLPAAVPVGMFRVDAYVFQNGVLRSRNRIALEVVKEGFERAVYTFANSFPFLYGLTAVLIALGAGWLAGIAGKK